MSVCRAYGLILWLAPTMSKIGAEPISCGENNIAGSCDFHAAAVGGGSMVQHTAPPASFLKDSFVNVKDTAGLTEQKAGAIWPAMENHKDIRNKRRSAREKHKDIRNKSRSAREKHKDIRNKRRSEPEPAIEKHSKGLWNQNVGKWFR
eukprot:TRINITY_DN281_c0_g1_i1.p2 TRINITY_DN281_c0_g1~~TRINITY_DN281_c0_g1_i1.p2  ORF type:complete len:148 (+),score=19.14 TRINITY_DN281_c0_g1_i1:76-519(+)